MACFFHLWELGEFTKTGTVAFQSLESFPGHFFPFTSGVTCTDPGTGPFFKVS